MWVIENDTPFQAERSFSRDENGTEIWIVVVKATFDIVPDGSTVIAENQEPVCLIPEYFGEPGISSLKYDSDIVLDKPRTDILLHGHAYAPNDEEIKKIEVSMSVGAINKKLLVVGDQFWESGLFNIHKTTIEPFKKMPLVYERSYGGTDQTAENSQKHVIEPRNPVGTGISNKSSFLEGKRVPNIRFADSFGKKKISKTPAGFGPIPSSWVPRVNFAGTYDEHWQNTRKPLLPVDFDRCYHQCAPLDQQSKGYLKGGEKIELINLTKSGKLSFRLPKIVLGFKTVFDKTSIEQHQANLHTVFIEPDYPRVTMTWHTSLVCHHREDVLLGTHIIVKT